MTVDVEAKLALIETELQRHVWRREQARMAFRHATAMVQQLEGARSVLQELLMSPSPPTQTAHDVNGGPG